MPVALTHHPKQGYLEVMLTDKLTHDDFEQFGPRIEQLIADHGPLHVLVDMQDSHGWTFGGFWEDVKFDLRHAGQVERVAIVGDENWHEAMARFCKPFTSAEVRYFEPFESAEARAWLIREEQPAAQSQQSSRRA